jgi:hypothetical protein
MVSALIVLICGWLYGKGKKILQQAAEELRGRALIKIPKQDEEIHGKLL